MILLVVGFAAGGFVAAMIIVALKRFFFRKEYENLKKLEAELRQKNQDELENGRRQMTLELKEAFNEWKNDFTQKQNERINRINQQERRLNQREEVLDRRLNNLENRDRELKKKERELEQREREINENRKKVDQLIEEQQKTLEKIAGMTTAEAREVIIKKYESEARLEAAQKLKQIEEELKEKSIMLSQNIVANAVQRLATEHIIASSVTVVDLPSDEMKGRIIGREGRNIRTLENATGVDFIVDDTPEAIIISSFDPIRREIARQAIETLVSDGRIHPARIEEVVDKIKNNFENYLRKIGEDAVVELGIRDIHPELFFYLGKLKFRSSYGQNVLEHSKEVAQIAAFMARELGVNVNLAKRAGLLHDIGKAIDRESEGTHTELSVELARRFGENEVVQQAISSHHMDRDFPSIEAVLLQAADGISAARPGARREILEAYIKRLEKLEEISRSFEGVQKAFALQAGREVRVIINSNELDDNKTYLLCREIAKKIENEMEYPGQIKVTVIREVRAIEYAK